MKLDAKPWMRTHSITQDYHSIFSKLLLKKCCFIGLLSKTIHVKGIEVWIKLKMYTHYHYKD